VSINRNQLLNKILDLQKNLYPNSITIPVIRDNYINEFSKNENSVRIIFDHIHFKILHISDNVESLGGYPAKDFLETNMLLALKLLDLEHSDFLYIWLKWAFSLHVKFTDLYNAKQAIAGIKVKHKEGHTMRLLFRHYALEQTEGGIPTIGAITVDDIGHLMKADFYWGRIEHGKNEKHIHHLMSTDKKDRLSDIITDREKDTLRLIAQGKESKEIGTLLHISSHTVDNHRRNMINKIGVRDTTGLVQICKMVGII
jgi:DNA-binding CsgD family transcriptional regulator